MRIYKNILKKVVNIQPFYKHLTTCHLFGYSKAIRHDASASLFFRMTPSFQNNVVSLHPEQDIDDKRKDMNGNSIDI